jgi:hypothetical protein
VVASFPRGRRHHVIDGSHASKRARPRDRGIFVAWTAFGATTSVTLAAGGPQLLSLGGATEGTVTDTGANTVTIRSQA